MNKISIGILGLVIGAVLMALILDRCNPTKITSPTSITIDHYRDSTFYSDTLGVWTDTVTHKYLVPTYVELDTTGMDLSDTNAFRTKYHYLIQDSLLNATITATSQDRPDVSFSYTLKNHTITNNISVKDSTYVKEIVRARSIYFGGEVAVTPFSQAYLGLDYADRKGNLFGISQGYDFVNQNPITKISYKRNINWKKN